MKLGMLFLLSTVLKTNMVGFALTCMNMQGIHDSDVCNNKEYVIYSVEQLIFMAILLKF